MAFPHMTTWFLSNVFGISDVPFVSGGWVRLAQPSFDDIGIFA